MKYISQKIFFAFLLLIVVLSGSILILITRTISASYDNSFQEELAKFSRVSHDQIQALVVGKQYEELENLVIRFGVQTSIRFTVIDLSGKVLADSYAEPDTMDNHNNRTEIKEAIKNGNSILYRYSNTFNRKMLYRAENLTVGDQSIGVLRLSIFANDISEVTGRIKLQIFVVTAFLSLLAIIGVYFFSRSFTKPIVSLTEASKVIAAGNFDVRVNVYGNDEISNLAAHFNEMTAKTNELVQKITIQKEDYRVLISSIREGLLVLDTNMLILHANDSLVELLDANVERGSDFNQCIKDSELKTMISEIIKERKSCTENIEFNDKYLILSAVFMAERGEVIILFHDVTESKKIEIFKRDFIVNVSHELRTPLTAIKGFVETLEDEIEGEDNQYYIEIINRHTDRLINIVQDLLVLSELEEASLELMLTRVDVRKLIDNMLSIYETKAAQKKISISKSYPQKISAITIDAFRIEQVLVNLIDNAIKYTDEGTVSIDVSEDKYWVILAITDTGNGINDEDKERIFERFYRADKSRSRKAGGTGLGLSIVKHIVLQHKGTIEVQSEIGKGTTFIIKLPK